VALPGGWPCERGPPVDGRMRPRRFLENGAASPKHFSSAGRAVADQNLRWSGRVDDVSFFPSARAKNAGAGLGESGFGKIDDRASPHPSCWSRPSGTVLYRGQSIFRRASPAEDAAAATKASDHLSRIPIRRSNPRMTVREIIGRSLCSSHGVGSTQRRGAKKRSRRRCATSELHTRDHAETLSA